MTTNNAGGMYNDETQKYAITEGLDALYGEETAPTENTDSKRCRLFELHQRLTSEGLNLMRMKNADYGALDDPFANFRKRGAVGILTRLDDKIARLDSFVEKGHLKLQSESVKDTVIDGINYLVLLYGYLLDQEVVHE